VFCKRRLRNFDRRVARQVREGSGALRSARLLAVLTGRRQYLLRDDDRRGMGTPAKRLRMRAAGEGNT
jgi:hypothetical protein